MFLWIPFYTFLSVSPLCLFFSPQQLEKTLNNFFGEIVVKKPLAKKEMKKSYEGYRARSLKSKNRINQIITYAEYSDHKKKNFKTWNGLEPIYKKDWNYIYKLTCFLYKLIFYFI